MEELKATAAAVQAAAAVRFDLLQRREQQRLGVRAEELGRGVGAQVALARRDSPARGGRHLGLAKALLQELPCTFRALSAGVLTEWRATLVARETACLDPGDRAEVDRVIAGDLEEVSRLGDRAIVAKLRRLTYRIDPESAVRRSRKAEGERNVSCRPAPDTMTYLTGLLPVAQGVAVYASLSREADRVRAAGDPRGRGQIMADTLVERVTGAPACGGQRVEVQLIMTDRTLLHGGREPAVLAGYGVVPGRWAREAVAEASEAAIRRLYTAPESRDLVAMESRARIFPAGLARFIGARDQFCRTPWCGAPIRHIDHVRPHATGGTTSAGNGQGLCESCNYAKDAPGWSTTPDGAAAGCTPDSTAGQSAFAAGKSGGSGSDGGGGESHRGGRGSVEKGSAGTDAGPARSDPPLSPHLTRPPGARSFIRTPTGHVYESAAPMPPGAESEV